MKQYYHVLGAKQFEKNELERLFDAAREMEGIVARGGDRRHEGRIMTTLFFEASTRTRLSFESAMHRLGGNVIGTENAAQFSSAIKGRRWRTRFGSSAVTATLSLCAIPRSAPRNGPRR